MKARVIETGEIIDVVSLYPVTYSRLDCNGKIFEEYDGDELEFINTKANTNNKESADIAEQLVEMCKKSLKKCKNNPALFSEEDLKLQEKELEVAKRLLESVKNKSL
jgi:hypothetical protein